MHYGIIKHWAARASTDATSNPQIRISGSEITPNPVDFFNAELERVIRNMIETMYAAFGAGLAANKVGILFIDHLSGLKRNLIMNRVKRLMKAGKWQFPGCHMKIPAHSSQPSSSPCFPHCK